MIGKLFHASSLLTPEERKSVTRTSGIIAGIAVLFIVALACVTAGNVVSADSPWWDAVLQARLILFRLTFAIVLIAVGFYTALVLFSVFAKTALGHRTVVPQDGEGTTLSGFKIGNAGFVQGLLMLACIAGLLVGVLR
jgi:thiol:disulfide interchange protein